MANRNNLDETGSETSKRISMISSPLTLKPSNRKSRIHDRGYFDLIDEHTALHNSPVNHTW